MKIRINDLARELEVKSKMILDALIKVGVTEEKTHSSSIEVAEAERVKTYFAEHAEPGTSRATRASVSEFNPKLDLSHISKPGDVMKAVTQRAAHPSAIARPATPPTLATPAVPRQTVAPPSAVRPAPSVTKPASVAPAVLAEPPKTAPRFITPQSVARPPASIIIPPKPVPVPPPAAKAPPPVALAKPKTLSRAERIIVNGGGAAYQAALDYWSDSIEQTPAREDTLKILVYLGQLLHVRGNSEAALSYLSRFHSESIAKAEGTNVTELMAWGECLYQAVLTAVAHKLRMQFLGEAGFEAKVSQRLEELECSQHPQGRRKPRLGASTAVSATTKGAGCATVVAGLGLVLAVILVVLIQTLR
jgi:hypothetical protein